LGSAQVKINYLRCWWRCWFRNCWESKSQALKKFESPTAVWEERLQNFEGKNSVHSYDSAKGQLQMCWVWQWGRHTSWTWQQHYSILQSQRECLSPMKSRQLRQGAIEPVLRVELVLSVYPWLQVSYRVQTMDKDHHIT